MNDAPSGMWLARIEGARGRWALVWARSRRQAQALLARDVGKIEAGSLVEVQGAGYFLFGTRGKDAQGVEPLPGETLILYDDAAADRIARRESPATARRRSRQP